MAKPEYPNQSQGMLKRPHHSSPEPGDVQTPFPKPPGTSVEREEPRKLRRMPPVPQHLVKHPNPVGRPKNPRG
jgi:hypothetical protein